MAVMFGQILAYSAFSKSHFSSPGSVSGLIASTGHSGFAHPQIDALIRVDDVHVLALVEAVHVADLNAVHVFAANATLVDDVGQLDVSSPGKLIHGARPGAPWPKNELRGDKLPPDPSEHQT